MSRAKQHHFVPRWYLERFASPDGFLYLYDQARNMWRHQRPDKVMRINGYYRQEWAPAGIDPDVLENLFSWRIEVGGQQALDKLVRGGVMSAMDLADILVYIEFQRIRVPRQAEVAKEIARGTLLRNLKPEAVDLVLRGNISITIKDSIRFRMMHNLAGKLSPWLTRMKWLLIESPSDAAFITSDSPVSFYNPLVLPPAEAGLAMAGTMVLFPLSSRYLLLLRHPEANTEGISPTMHLPPPASMPDRLSFQRWGACPTEEVRNFNRVIMALSDELIVANSRRVLESCIEDEEAAAGDV